MSHDEIIEQAAQVISTLTTCDGQPHATELHHRQAHALADAGLLVQPMDKVVLDRWLEQVKADAWEEGQIDGQINAHEHRAHRKMQNPYRQENS